MAEATLFLTRSSFRTVLLWNAILATNPFKHSRKCLAKMHSTLCMPRSALRPVRNINRPGEIS